MTNKEQIKIQAKSFIAYINIEKEPKKGIQNSIDINRSKRGVIE